MVNRPCGNISHIAARTTSDLYSPFILLQAVSIRQSEDARSGRVKTFKGINLFKEIEVALKTAFEGLIGLLPSEYLTRALYLRQRGSITEKR